MTRREDDIWILIADATRARILRGIARAGEAPLPELVMRTEAHKLRDIMADKPGRTSFIPSLWAALDYGTDPLKDDDRKFLREVAALLDSHRRAGEFRRLAIFAEPRTLGLLRTILPVALRRLVCHETAANLLKVPPQELPQLLLRHLHPLA